MAALIEAEGLSKHFGKVQALDELDLSLPSGQVVAILGPNGAGKTTFIRTVATLLRPDAGTLRVAGHDVARESMADPPPHRPGRPVGGRRGDDDRPGEPAHGRPPLRPEQARRRGRAPSGYSTWWDSPRPPTARPAPTRAACAAASTSAPAWSGTPRLLLLDEPTTGLDPGSRIELWDAIRDLGNAGTDILLTTQYLDEADRLAASIVIIDEGRVIAQGTPGELKSRAGADMIELHTRDLDSLAEAARILSSLRGDEATVDPSHPPLLGGRPRRRATAARRGPCP